MSSVKELAPLLGPPITNPAISCPGLELLTARTERLVRRAGAVILLSSSHTSISATPWLPEALETAAVIAANAPISTRQIKQSVNYGLNMDLASGMMFEIEAYNRMVPTEDRREGIRAFNEKRKPNFQGR